MRSLFFVLAASSMLFAGAGCAAPTADDDDDVASESTESELAAGSLIGKRYKVTGTFVVRDRPTFANRHPVEKVLGEGSARLRITRAFKVEVPGFLGESDAFAANVRITYRSADGAEHVVADADRDFEPTPGGYGPFTDVVEIGGVELGVQISDFGKRRMFSATITPPAPNGKEILFRPVAMTGPF